MNKLKLFAFVFDENFHLILQGYAHGMYYVPKEQNKICKK